MLIKEKKPQINALEEIYYLVIIYFSYTLPVC